MCATKRRLLAVALLCILTIPMGLSIYDTYTSAATKEQYQESLSTVYKYGAHVHLVVFIIGNSIIIAACTSAGCAMITCLPVAAAYSSVVLTSATAKPNSERLEIIILNYWADNLAHCRPPPCVDC